MNMSSSLLPMDKIMWLKSLILVVAFGLLPGIAAAAQVSIFASFKPDPTQPMRNVFKNETPPGDSYCGWAPQYCHSDRYSIGAPITFRLAQTIQPGHDERQGVMFRAPTYRQNVTVIHEETGESQTLQFRVSGIGMGITDRPEEPGTWETSWTYPPAPCVNNGTAVGSPAIYLFTYFLAEGAEGCAIRAAKPVSLLTFRSFGFAYELVTPNPLGMRVGIYRGQTTYSVGPNKDFDLGDVMLPDDDQITLDFRLTVEHTLKVDIPPGGTNVELVPQGGWQGWLNQGRKPTRLFKDQTVNLYVSSRFKMGLDCQYADADNDCRIRDSVSGESVPVNVSVSLPYGITDAAGRPVNRQPLRRDGVGTELFQPTFYVDRKASTLHFEIERDEVEKMLKVGETRTYSGNVTVIWDSEV